MWTLMAKCWLFKTQFLHPLCTWWPLVLQFCQTHIGRGGQLGVGRSKGIFQNFWPASNTFVKNKGSPRFSTGSGIVTNSTNQGANLCSSCVTMFLIHINRIESRLERIIAANFFSGWRREATAPTESWLHSANTRPCPLFTTLPNIQQLGWVPLNYTGRALQAPM